MYLPRSLISQLYLSLQRSHHALSPPVLILVALEPDALCACRILTALLKRDYIPHKIHPVTGYGNLTQAGVEFVQPMRHSVGGAGGVVACLGVGGLIDLESMLGLDEDGIGADGVEVWVFDSRRPWNLSNVFGAGGEGLERGKIGRLSRAKGGIVVFDDGDIEAELSEQADAWFGLEDMPDVDVSDSESEDEDDTSSETSRKRKHNLDESEKENRPNQRRRSNSSTPIYDRLQTPPSNQLSSPPEVIEPVVPTAKQLRREFTRLRRKHEDTIRAYHSLGTSYSEPIASLMYSLASELGREDNDLLWLAIVGVSSTELYGKTSTGFSLTDFDQPVAFTSWSSARGARIRQMLCDEVRRLNPPEMTETGREVNRGDVIPTHARSPTDNSIRLSPEPRFLLIRHWSLYDSMLHSPYLSAKLHIWSEPGRRRLHKLLAKMGVSLTQCKQSYTHMDMDLKKDLRQKLLKCAPIYGLDGLLPPAQGRSTEGWGFVRSWGWKACLSAADVAVVLGAILEAGIPEQESNDALERFYAAYDALLSPTLLTQAIPQAQALHRAILRTGTSLLQKRQIKHLSAFRMGLVKEGPDVKIFASPGALTKLALWVGGAVAEMEKDNVEGHRKRRGGTPLVLGCLDEARGTYIVVGLGGGSGAPAQDEQEKIAKAAQKAAKQKEREKRAEARRVTREELGEDDETEDDTESEEDDDDDNESQHHDRNRFGVAFQQVVQQTNARVRLDSFEHCIVEVKKEDFGGFLESLSMQAPVG